MSVPTERDVVIAALMPALHNLSVQIPGLNRDCACNLVAQVAADAIFGIEGHRGTVGAI